MATEATHRHAVPQSRASSRLAPPHWGLARSKEQSGRTNTVLSAAGQPGAVAALTPRVPQQGEGTATKPMSSMLQHGVWQGLPVK